MIPARIASTTSSGTSVIPWADAACALWLERTQARQTDAFYRCLTMLASAWSQLADQQLAVTLAESAAQLGPLRETGHRLLIEAEGARGDRGAALRAFKRCEHVLADDST